MLLLLFLIFTLVSHILDLSRQVSDPYQIDTLKAYRRKLNATKSICFASNKQSALLNQQRSEESYGPWSWQHAFCDTEISRDNFELLLCNSVV